MGKIITICGSMSFAKEMLYCKELLEGKYGHSILVPEDTEGSAFGRVGPRQPAHERKIQHGLIKKHFEKIDSADAILVLNLAKNGTEHYIGANTFLEMGIAFRRGIPIFLLNPIPENPYIWDEAVAMQPIVLFGDFSHIALHIT